MMDYALVMNGVIQAEMSVAPGSAAPDETTGYIPIVETDRPADTGIATTVRTLQLVNGTPTVVWMSRAWLPDELAARIDQAKTAALIASITTLRSWAVTGRTAVVTSGNAVATLATIVKNLAEFYDGFANLLELELL